MRSVLRTTLALVLTLAVTGPAVATHNGEVPPPGCRWIRGTDTPENHDDDVYVCRQDAWIHHGGARLGNLAAQGLAALPSWNTTPPTASLQDGGGFWVTNSITRQPTAPEDARGSFVARGGFTGVLDNIAVDLYAYVTPVYSQDLNIELTIDDQQLFGAAVPDVRNAAAGSFQRIRFAFTNIYEVLESLGFPNGNATAHTLRVTVGGVYVVNDPMVFVYDAADAPAGVVFNHDALTTDYTQLELTPAE